MQRRHTWRDYPWPLSVFEMSIAYVTGTDFENSLYAFGQSEKR